MKVLIVTHSKENDSVQLVTESLSARGVTSLRLDSDWYPTALRFSTKYGHKGQEIFVGTTQGRMELTELDAIWYRRFFAGSGLQEHDLGDAFEACVQESQMTLGGHIRALDCFHLDPLANIRVADYKELQLREASKLQISLPKTLISNDPEEARQFIEEVDGQVVTKMQSQFAIYREGREEVVFTSLVREENIEQLEGLKFSPMIFQEMVPKDLELRVTVVGRQIFAASIDSQKSERAKVDWRRDGNQIADQWKPFSFPEEEGKKLLALADWFGLNYLAADYILTPDGEFVFLELNACGEWLWLQLFSGLDIATAIADLLLDPDLRR